MIGPMRASFVGGAFVAWRVERMETIAAAGFPAARRVDAISLEPGSTTPSGHWVLTGMTTNARYTTRDETTALTSRQEPLGRTEASLTALIPIRKSSSWWSLTQDERRSILEAQS